MRFFVARRQSWTRIGLVWLVLALASCANMFGEYTNPFDPDSTAFHEKNGNYDEADLVSSTTVTMTISDGTKTETLSGNIPVNVQSDTLVSGAFTATERLFFNNVAANTEFTVTVSFADSLLIPSPRPSSFLLSISDIDRGSVEPLAGSTIDMVGTAGGFGVDKQGFWRDTDVEDTYGLWGRFGSSQYLAGQTIDSLTFVFTTPTDLTSVSFRTVSWAAAFSSGAGSATAGYLR